MNSNVEGPVLDTAVSILEMAESQLRRKPEEACAMAEELERRAVAEDDWAVAARAARIAGSGAFYGSRLREARSAFLRAISHLGKAEPDPSEESRSRSGLGGVLLQIGAYKRAFYELARAVDLSKGSGGAERVRALNNYAVALSESGRNAEALAALEAAIPLAESVTAFGDEEGERLRGALYVNTSEILRELKRFDDALILARTGKTVALLIDDRIGVSTARAAEAEALLALGLRPESFDAFRDALEQYRSLGIPVHAAEAAISFASALLSDGLLDEAERVVFEHMDEDGLDARNAPKQFRLAARIHAERGRWREAYLSSERASEFERSAGSDQARHAALSSIAERSIRRAREVRKRFRRWQDVVIRGLVELVGERDGETREHVERTAEIVFHVARELVRAKAMSGFGAREVADLVRVAPLHDIGKVAVPDAIFGKPGPLSMAEAAAMRAHVEAGREFFVKAAAGDGDRHLALAARVAGSHHERWDGKGYPEGLRGEDIPPEARIMAVADVYDAMRSERPYKRPFGREEALAYIRDNAGAHFDPLVVEAFLAVEAKVAALYAEELPHTARIGASRVPLALHRSSIA